MKLPTDYLTISFLTCHTCHKKPIMAKIRFKVIQRSQLAKIKIYLKGDRLYPDIPRNTKRSRQNVIYVDTVIKKELFEKTLIEFLKNRFLLDEKTIKMEWEDGNKITFW